MLPALEVNPPGPVQLNVGVPVSFDTCAVNTGDVVQDELIQIATTGLEFTVTVRLQLLPQPLLPVVFNVSVKLPALPALTVTVWLVAPSVIEPLPLMLQL